MLSKKQEYASTKGLVPFNIILASWGTFNNVDIQAGAELGQAQVKLGFDFTLVFWKFIFSESSPKMEKNHPMVPPLDNFQGKNKNCSSLAKTISASRRSFFTNLTTFERRSGLKEFSLLKIAILRRKILFSPERRSIEVKFAKNDHLDTLIVLARDEQFLFFFWKWSKEGTIG